MKPILIAFLCLVLSFGNTQAQTTFAPPSSEWYHADQHGYYHSYYNGDTTIDGLLCSIVEQDIFVPSFYWPVGYPPLYTYVSGDTVFVYNQLFQRLTPLYIFNVNDGDTVRIPGFYAEPFASDTTLLFRVDSVRMVLYDTVMLKTVYTQILSNEPSPPHVTSIYSGAYAEKIGCIRQGIYPACLGCPVTLGGEDVWIGPVLCYNEPSLSVKLVSGPCAPYVSVDDVVQYQGFDFAPNPADQFIEVSANENYKLTIANIDGRAIKCLSTGSGGKKKINISDIPAGTYIIRAAADAGPAIYKRLLVVH